MDKIALILGASSDIGLSLIKNIYTNYDAIIAHYNKNNQSLLSLKDSLGEKLHILQADFSSEQDTQKLIVQIENEFGNPMHIIHLPACKVRNINFHKSCWGHVETDINVSLRSIYEITRHFIKPMIKAKQGKIVFVLTSCTVLAPKFMLDYTLVKYALLGFMKSLATEYADKHISVNAISPSMIETKFLSDIPQIIIEQSAENNPLKRNATAEDVIPMIELLLSEKSDYITGQNIVISGGSVI